MTTVAITDYASLSTAINDFPERSYDQGTIDRFIGLAEGFIRLYLGPNFAKNASVTLTVTSGSAALPAGFVRALSVVHATYGQLTEKAIGEVRQRRVVDTSGVPDIYAITGSTVEIAPSFSGSLTMDLEGSLTGLSGSNTTNWLVTNAPQVYLACCLAVEAGYRTGADLIQTQGAVVQICGDLGLQSNVGAHGRAAVTIPGWTP